MFEGRAIPFRAGQSLAGALMAAGIVHFRKSPVSGSERGPWCLMGICYECLLRIDGNDNQRACSTAARPGMKVERQNGARLDAVREQA